VRSDSKAVDVYLVAQLGARMHYAVPRILNSAGRLATLHTDFAANVGILKLLSLLPTKYRPVQIQKILGRVPVGVPADRIRAYPFLGLTYGLQLRRSKNSSALTAAYLWSAKEFTRRILDSGLGEASGVYTFNSAGLELLQAARTAGLRAVMEQTIAPKSIERNLLEEQFARFPDWEESPLADDHAVEYADREFAEWDSADTIVCGSDFVRDGISQCGGPLEKCVVIPYGVDLPNSVRSNVNEKFDVGGSELSRPLRVLTVGTICLRKGSPYVLDAARKLKGFADFRMVGPLNVSETAQTQLRNALDLVGSVPRSLVTEHFAWADVFLLPSVCEGSATVTYEAFAHGLPVICTPNTGSTVVDRRDGFLVQVGDVDTIVERLMLLRTNIDVLKSMSDCAHQRALEFTVEAYGKRLLATL
jgi:hypothetical protein